MRLQCLFISRGAPRNSYDASTNHNRRFRSTKIVDPAVRHGREDTYTLSLSRSGSLYRSLPGGGFPPLAAAPGWGERRAGGARQIRELHCQAGMIYLTNISIQPVPPPIPLLPSLRWWLSSRACLRARFFSWVLLDGFTFRLFIVYCVCWEFFRAE